MMSPSPGGQGRREVGVTALGPLLFGLGAVGRGRRLATPAGSEAEPAAALGGPVGGVAEVLGNVGHGLGRAGELAAALLTAGLHVAPRGRVKVACRLEIKLGPRRGFSLAELGDPFVGAVQVATDPFAGVFGAEPAGGRRQVGIAAVEKRGVVGVVGGPGQVMSGGPVLVGEEIVAGIECLQAVAVILRGALGPVANPLLGAARGAVVGAEAAEQVVRLPQVAPGPGLSFFLGLFLALGLGRLGPSGPGGCGGKKAASPRLTRTDETVATSLSMSVLLPRFDCR